MSDGGGASASAVALLAEDTAARERALDVACSFLVQAPAGSGKTELLIQRFLALLARVERPEHIVAMTFTRKAAGEMRDRIIDALAQAASASPVDSPHAQRTRDLALAALMQDSRHGWQLVAHPSRLQVQTIDALCAGIARQAPLAAKLGAAPRYEERAAPLYAQAARAAMQAAAPGDPDWRRLLAHVDNDAGAAIELLSGMLARRDQWLPELAEWDLAAFRRAVEATLAAEIEGELGGLRAAFAPGHAAALVEFERYAAHNLAGDPERTALSAALARIADAGGVPAGSLADQDDWRALADWLLRANDAAFRKALHKNKGFPGRGTGAGAADRDARNKAVRGLLAELALEPGLAASLDVARRLPPPRCDDEAWAVVEALRTVLMQVTAQLTLVFREQGAVDFAQGTLSALDALGSPDAPTDLLLRLDWRIEHLLVDEFQDTSLLQLELLRRLTAGWQDDDGRTLFAVGDPMQSIYRFREAEVRLFGQAQQERRIGSVAIECLTLRRNFRSQAGLVRWTNAAFARVLGARNDPWRSIVGFAPAVAVHPALAGTAVTVDVCTDADAEAAAVVDQVRAALAEAPAQIAVLVRARTHLDALLPALRTAAIPFSAVELDALAERQAVQDLVSLTHALAQPVDRLAWLAVLRAPWCGLGLADLFAVFSAADAAGLPSLAAVLSAQRPIAGLSAEGGRRLDRLAQALLPALAARGRATLCARVRGAWLALGGPACLDDAIDLNAAERVFALLAEHESAGEIAAWPTFVGALARLHAEPDIDPATRVQVMTLHRAKGLQFDVVILPGLGRSPNSGGNVLLRWRRRPQGLLLAPMKARGGDPDPVYAYLNQLAAAEEDAELGRLLYVGCTRARSRLHLTAVAEVVADDSGAPAWKAPASGSALAKLWPALEAAVAAPQSDGADLVARPDPALSLIRLPADWLPSLPEVVVPIEAAAGEPRAFKSLPFDWARETARHVGTVAHRVFAQIAGEGLAAWAPARVGVHRARIRSALRGEGVDVPELDAATRQVEAAVLRLLDDPRGRWLFAPTHADARSEWALAGVDGIAIVHVVIDRSFVADGVRWIVDFKTGGHQGADSAAFLDREQVRYAPQLERYARIVRSLDPRPARVALYFPLLAGWREWEPALDAAPLAMTGTQAT